MDPSVTEWPENGEQPLDLLAAACDNVARRATAGEFVPISDLLLPLVLHASSSPCLHAECLGFWREGNAIRWLPRFVFEAPGPRRGRIELGVFAGIHGDEPAGIFALMDFARLLDAEPELARDYRLSLYPLCNPGGYERGIRESPSGKDLNREFWVCSREPEVVLLEKELRNTRFDGIISLHSDDTCGGFYGYARDRLISEQMLRPALAAAGAVIACDANPVIDGFEAVDGIIHAAYPGILTSPPERVPRPFEVILESPAHAPLSAQRDSMTRALRAILESYRSFIAYGGDL